MVQESQVGLTFDDLAASDSPLGRFQISQGIVEDQSEYSLLLEEVLGGPQGQHFCKATEAYFKSVGVKNIFMMDEKYLTDPANAPRIAQQFDKLRYSVANICNDFEDFLRCCDSNANLIIALFTKSITQIKYLQT